MYSTMDNSSVTTTYRSRKQGAVNRTQLRLHRDPHPRAEQVPASVLTSAALITLLYPERLETPPQPSCFVPFRRDADFVHRKTLPRLAEWTAPAIDKLVSVGASFGCAIGLLQLLPCDSPAIHDRNACDSALLYLTILPSFPSVSRSLTSLSTRTVPYHLSERVSHGSSKYHGINHRYHRRH
jgi:hypothetical protein